MSRNLYYTPKYFPEHPMTAKDLKNSIFYKTITGSPLKVGEQTDFGVVEELDPRLTEAQIYHNKNYYDADRVQVRANANPTQKQNELREKFLNSKEQLTTIGVDRPIEINNHKYNELSKAGIDVGGHLILIKEIDGKYYQMPIDEFKFNGNDF